MRHWTRQKRERFHRTVLLFLSAGFRRVTGMSALQSEPMSSDALVVRLDQMLADLADAVADNSTTSDAARVDRIARLEKLRAVTAALQAAESVRFAQSQVAEQLAADVHPTVIGRGIAEQIGLACRLSPVVAGPAIEYGAGVVVRTTRHLRSTQ